MAQTGTSTSLPAKELETPEGEDCGSRGSPGEIKEPNKIKSAIRRTEKLTKEEILRYSRQLLVPEISVEGILGPDNLTVDPEFCSLQDRKI